MMAEHIDFTQERGQHRLENWRAWSKHDPGMLAYPKQSTLRRHYRPEDGNLWDGEPDVMPFDEPDALLVEAIIRTFEATVVAVIKAAYLDRRGLRRLEEDFRMQRWRLASMIAQVEREVGRRT